MKQIVTRFAPSPTGKLHIGGLRIALINWLAAKKNDGKFVLRIEDTDAARNEDRYVDSIIDGLRWLRINYDVYLRQSEQLNNYLTIAQNLVEAKKAYYCTCPAPIKTKRDLEKIVQYSGKCRGNFNKPDGQYVIRLNSQQTKSVAFDDLIFGKITVTKDNLDDIVLVRSDGTPTYPFAVTIDDFNGQITIVARGADHLVNTGKQILVYEACGWELPMFAHIPLMLSESGQKLSKRDSSFSLEDCREEGILPKALIAYAFGINFGFDFGRELPTVDEMKAAFCWDKIGVSPAKFDKTRLLNINQSAMMCATTNEMLQEIRGTKYGMNEDHESLVAFWEVWKGRALTLREYIKQSAQIRQIYSFEPNKPPISFEHITKDADQILVAACIDFLQKIEWQQDIFHNISSDIKKKFFPMLRKIFVGNVAGAPPISDLLLILGREKTFCFLKNISQSQ